VSVSTGCAEAEFDTSKLQHDAEQLELLLSRGLLQPAGHFARLKNEIHAVLKEAALLEAEIQEGGKQLFQRGASRCIRLTDPEQVPLLQESYGSILYVRPSAAFPTGVLTFDAEAAALDYFDGDIRAAAVDRFMTRAALAELHQFCVESTVFHDAKVSGLCGC
jgi:hypothetical protein